MATDQELIWVPKKKAEEYKAAQGENAQLAIIDDIIANTKHNMRDDLKALDEDVLRFKGMLIAYKNAYSEALQAHYEATYKIWEDIDAKIPNLKAKAAKSVQEFSDVTSEAQKALDIVDTFAKKADIINTYSLTRMVELVQAIQNTDDKTKDILAKVLAEK